MTSDNRPRRRMPSPATVLAAIAVFAVLAGTATAAKSVISGKQIKKGTITAKQIKKKTIGVNKLTDAAVSSLRGATGPQGQRGEKGEKGAQGEKGEKGEQGNAPAGIVQPLFDSVDSGTNINAGSETELLDIPITKAGTYVINAKVNMFSLTAAGQVECFLTSGNKQVDMIQWTADDANSRQSGSLQAVAQATQANPIELGCGFTGSNGSISEKWLTAIPVG